MQDDEDTELAFHLEAHTRDLFAEGIPPQGAYRRAVHSLFLLLRSTSCTRFHPSQSLHPACITFSRTKAPERYNP